MTASFQTKVTDSGEISIPDELRKELGIEPGDSVVISSDEGEIRVRKMDSVVLRTARSVIPPPGPRKTDHEIREEVEQGIADDVARRGRLFVKD